MALDSSVAVIRNLELYKKTKEFTESTGFSMYSTMTKIDV
jgi:hypothetical protein